jgi:hypothetical protein
MKIRSALALLGLTVTVPFMCFGGPTYYLTTGQSNANTTVDADHEMEWVNPGSTQDCLVTNCQSFTVAAFTPTFNWDLGGGIFTIKVNGSPTDDIYFDLWDITDTAVTGTPDALSGVLVAQASVSSGAVDNSYTATDFFFETPVTLQIGESYIATLTSNTATHGSQQYFIKGIDALNIQDSTTGGGDSLSDPSNDPAGVPEPSCWATMAGGMLFVLTAVLKYKPRR